MVIISWQSTWSPSPAKVTDGDERWAGPLLKVLQEAPEKSALGRGMSWEYGESLRITIG